MTKVIIDDRPTFTALWMGDLTVEQIAEIYGVTKASVSNAAARFSLPKRGRYRRRVDATPDVRGSERADPPAERFARTCARLDRLRKAGKIPVPPEWPLERDIAVLRSGGAYGALHELAEREAVPFTRLLARWHVVRAI